MLRERVEEKEDHVLLKSLTLKAVMDHVKYALKEPPIICDKYK